jgi:hypothetical protein
LLTYYALDKGRLVSFNSGRDRDDWVKASPETRKRISQVEKQSKFRSHAGKYAMELMRDDIG